VRTKICVNRGAGVKILGEVDATPRRGLKNGTFLKFDSGSFFVPLPFKLELVNILGVV
jgi:hypothetical protein